MTAANRAASSDMTIMLTALSLWSPRRWGFALLGSILTALLVALPTAVIPNPIFGRAIEVTWWSYPVVVITALLGGLLIATYVRDEAPGIDPEATVDARDSEADRASRLGVAAAFVSFVAVGCPVCNKLVLVALGTSGAVAWFAPIQPFLALASIALMAVALVIRLRNETSCRVRPSPDRIS